MAQFPAASISAGTIFYADFLSYYTDLSSLWAADDAFNGIVQDTWALSTSSSSTVSVDELKGIVENLRVKLINITNGSQDETVLRTVFNQFDSNKSGFLTYDELNALLIRLEMGIAPKFLGALFNFIDTNKSGYIEFLEFANYIVYDPYP